jgi:protein TonB
MRRLPHTAVITSHNYKAAMHSPSRSVRVAAALAALALSFGALAAPKLLNRVDLEFPREARAAGVDRGAVKARMTLDASGEVVKVDIVDATPRRVFDRAVVRALSQWRYEAGDNGRTIDVDLEFKL